MEEENELHLYMGDDEIKSEKVRTSKNPAKKCCVNEQLGADEEAASSSEEEDDYLMLDEFESLCSTLYGKDNSKFESVNSHTVTEKRKSKLTGFGACSKINKYCKYSTPFESQTAKTVGSAADCSRSKVTKYRKNSIPSESLTAKVMVNACRSNDCRSKITKYHRNSVPSETLTAKTIASAGDCRSKITKYNENSIPSESLTAKAVASASDYTSNLASRANLVGPFSWMPKHSLERQRDKFVEELFTFHNLQENSLLKSESTADLDNFSENYRRRISFYRYRHYSLFKSDEVDHPLLAEYTGKDYFSILPVPIIEGILCHLSILDLMECRLVCSRWRDIIDREKFMKWKKFYYKLEPNIVENELTGPSPNFPFRVYPNGISWKSLVLEHGIKIIKYVQAKFDRIPSPEMSCVLMQHQYGKQADKFLSENFPELNGRAKRVWCQLAYSVLLSKNYTEIVHLYESFFTAKTSCLRVDIIDGLCCIASSMLHFELQHLFLYYNLYWALRDIESSCDFFSYMIKKDHNQNLALGEYNKSRKPEDDFRKIFRDFL